MGVDQAALINAVTAVGFEVVTTEECNSCEVGAWPCHNGAEDNGLQT